MNTTSANQPQPIGLRRNTCRLVMAVILAGMILNGPSLWARQAELPSHQPTRAELPEDGVADEAADRAVDGVTVRVAEDGSAGIPQAVSLAGHWSGSWYSCTTGHRGPLFAEFCPLSTGDYRVNFRGRFFRILPFRYTVVLRVVDQQDGVVHLQGQSYLGRLFGTFTYEATATESGFRATYRSCDDRGVFKLQRCCH
jgi:hypothetical protein